MKLGTERVKVVVGVWHRTHYYGNLPESVLLRKHIKSPMSLHGASPQPLSEHVSLTTLGVPSGFSGPLSEDPNCRPFLSWYPSPKLIGLVMHNNTPNGLPTAKILCSWLIKKFQSPCSYLAVTSKSLCAYISSKLKEILGLISGL